MLKAATNPTPAARPYAVRYRMDDNATANSAQPSPADPTPAHASPAASPALPEFIAIGSTLRRLLVQLHAVGNHLPLVAAFEGEPGSGKHLLALTLHHRSSVAALPFHRADAAQWLASDPEPETLHGTLYLERADHLSAAGQALLLQLLKSLEDRPIPDFQLLVAAHASLRLLAAQGAYLPDLAFRLSAVRFSLPPLRDHREDISAIAQALISRICRRYQRPPVSLAPGALPRMLQHPWPGNVRELSSQIESAILATTDGQLTADRFDLPSHTPPSPRPITTNADLARLNAGASPADGLADYPADLNLDAVILRHIHRTLDLYRGNKLRAARQLGISRSTLYRLLAGKSALSD